MIKWPGAGYSRDFADRSTVHEAAKAVVARVAPREMPFYSLLSDAYFDDPDRALTGDDPSGGPLKFGLTDVEFLVTPVALAVMTAVIERVVSQMLGKLPRQAIRSAVRRMVGLAAEDNAALPEKPVAWTDDQLVQIRKIVLDVAEKGRLPSEQSELLADAVIGQLVRPDRDPRE